MSESGGRGGKVVLVNERDDGKDDLMGQRMFRIWVAGRLKDGFAKAIDSGLEQEEAKPNTALSGELVDQAQLHGLLERLGKLGVEVVRFETYPSGGDGK